MANWKQTSAADPGSIPPVALCCMSFPLSLPWVLSTLRLYCPNKGTKSPKAPQVLRPQTDHGLHLCPFKDRSDRDKRQQTQRWGTGDRRWRQMIIIFPAQSTYSFLDSLWTLSSPGAAGGVLCTSATSIGTLWPAACCRRTWQCCLITFLFALML